MCTHTPHTARHKLVTYMRGGTQELLQLTTHFVGVPSMGVHQQAEGELHQIHVQFQTKPSARHHPRSNSSTWRQVRLHVECDAPTPRVTIMHNHGFRPTHTSSCEMTMPIMSRRCLVEERACSATAEHRFFGRDLVWRRTIRHAHHMSYWQGVGGGHTHKHIQHTNRQ